MGQIRNVMMVGHEVGTKEKAPDRPNMNGGTMQRVLIIDDSPSVIAKAKGVLEGAGYQIETLELLIHLPQVIRTSPPDVVLLDLNMPFLPGIEVAKLIERYQPHRIPLVIYSSKPEDELRRAAGEVGAVGYVQKGAPDSQLIDAVSEAHRRSQSSVLPTRRKAT